MKCLCCNKLLTDERFQHGWHDKCIKSFFNTRTFPEIELKDNDLVEYAMQYLDSKSVTGVQTKLSYYLLKERKINRLTIQNNNSFGYIVKVNESKYENIAILEHLTMLLAEQIGIRTVKHGLINLENGKLAYITKRMDRSNGHKIHMEDFCQISNKPTEYKYKGSYEKIAKLIDQYSETPLLDKIEFFKRIVFCFISANSDMHLKNFSLIYEGRKHLSYAYDLVPAQILVNDLDEMALTINGKQRNLRKNDFIKFADSIGVSSVVALSIIKTIKDARKQFIDTITEFELDNETKEKFINIINDRINRLE